jgi:hypothetical protein
MDDIQSYLCRQTYALICMEDSSDYGRGVCVCAFAAPTRAPTNDNTPTRAPRTYAPTISPTLSPTLPGGERHRPRPQPPGLVHAICPPMRLYSHGVVRADSRGLPCAGGREAAAEHWLGTRGYSRYRSGHWSARLRRHGRGAARAVPSCAGAYVAGDLGSNECPAGSVRIETEAACRTAVAAAGKPRVPGSPFAVTNSDKPKGCYYDANSNVAYFNLDAVGAGQSNMRPLCAVLTTTGAPFT